MHTRNSNSNNNFERFSHLAEPLEANHSSCCVVVVVVDHFVAVVVVVITALLLRYLSVCS